MRTHGRYATYNAGCRCDECRQASTRYQRNRRRQHHSRLPSGRPAEQDPMRWAERGACRTEPLAVFFPDHGGQFAYEAARAICAECTARDECLTYALRTGQRDGCWGGLTPEERYELDRTTV